MTAALPIALAGSSPLTLFLAFMPSESYFGGGGQEPACAGLWEVTFHFNKDSCPNISKGVSVVPREPGPNPNIAGLGVSASEETQRSDGRGLIDF